MDSAQAEVYSTTRPSDRLAALGVCYYPEHWPQEQWREQAEQMGKLGIDLVRIGEFAWSRIEPSPGSFQWDWLDRAIETLHSAGLSVIMCTPTACPPRWLTQQLPEILPTSIDGQQRTFGSRRHYRFSCERYRAEASRISFKVIDRYRGHPAVVGWQLDNEYGCHSTTRSYSPEDLVQFQNWLAAKYGSCDALNQQWGTVFWSQEYTAFQDVELPNQTVTEANPAHWLDFYRFASDQVREFNRQQTVLLRRGEESDSGDRIHDSIEAEPTQERLRPWITHNFMGNFTEFDHFAVGEDLDLATWDSYPLGFLDQSWFPNDEKLRYRRIGHPDWAAFHHDLYRAVGGGRFGVMEQQPGPVNWAESNALPLAGAPSFWAMEAVAHGAELVSFFRFQQYPRAQEQMHAALRLPNGQPAPAWDQAKRFRQALDQLPEEQVKQAPVALLFDYPSCWTSEIQAHAPGCWHLEWAFHFYSAVRQLGLDIDIVSATSALEGYELVLVPGTVFVSDSWIDQLRDSGAAAIFGPRSASREEDGAHPESLAPGAVQKLLPLQVVAVDSMRRNAMRSLRQNRFVGDISRWYEQIQSLLPPRLNCDDGSPFWFSQGQYHYLNGFPDRELLSSIVESVAEESEISTARLPEGLRLRRRGSLLFALNSSLETRSFRAEEKSVLLLGDEHLTQGAYAVWDTTASKANGD
ncbi:MAG: beta-galactosidase [Pseudomonadota bacterium]